MWLECHGWNANSGWINSYDITISSHVVESKRNVAITNIAEQEKKCSMLALLSLPTKSMPLEGTRVHGLGRPACPVTEDRP